MYRMYHILQIDCGVSLERGGWKLIHSRHRLTITMTSSSARWRPKSPASPLFTQPFIQAKHPSSAPLAFVRGIHRSPVNYPHKWPVTRKMFPFDYVIMTLSILLDTSGGTVTVGLDYDVIVLTHAIHILSLQTTCCKVYCPTRAFSWVSPVQNLSTPG